MHHLRHVVHGVLVENLGFSNSCASCWVSLASCTKSKCVWDCLNPTSSGCTKCAQSKCFPDLLSCSGFACNQLPGCESDSAKSNLPGCTEALDTSVVLQPKPLQTSVQALETAAVPTITLNNGVEMPTIAGTGGRQRRRRRRSARRLAGSPTSTRPDYYNPGVGRGVTSGRAPPPSR